MKILCMFVDRIICLQKVYQLLRIHSDRFYVALNFQYENVRTIYHII